MNKKVIFLMLFIFPVLLKGQSSLRIMDTLSNGVVIDNDSIIKCSNLWSIDKNGCLKFRDDATRIYLESFIGRSKKWKLEDIIKVWGEPNATYTTDDRFILNYYYNTICDDNINLTKDGDLYVEVIEYYFLTDDVYFTIDY